MEQRGEENMELSGWKRTVPYQNSWLKKRERGRERKGDKGTGIRNVDGRGIGRWNERKRGKGRAVQLHLTSVIRTMDRWSRRNASIRELTVDLSLPFSSIDVAHRRMQLDPNLNFFLPFRSSAIFETKRNQRGRWLSKLCVTNYRGEGEGREREKEGTEETRNLAGGFHHRRDGTRRLQDVSDLSIFSTRSTMNDPVSEPLLGQTWIIILTSGVKFARCNLQIFDGVLRRNLGRETRHKERRFECREITRIFYAESLSSKELSSK